VQQFRFVERAGTKVVPEPLVTLRARGGVPMTLKIRT